MYICKNYQQYFLHKIMISINITNLIGNLIIVTTPENANQDLETKILATVAKAVQHLQVLNLENQAQGSDKSDPQ